MQLRNKLSKEEALSEIRKEKTIRRTASFYRYVLIPNPQEMRDLLFEEWSKLKVLGRIYLSTEGVNAQMSIPKENWETFKNELTNHVEFKDMRINEAIEDNPESFWKLTIKVKKQIVADGLEEGKYDITNVGKHLDADEFNRLIEDPDAVVVDMRNNYESRIGFFKNALKPNSDRFQEELNVISEELRAKKGKKIGLYCTGGIRCEKASAYLRHQGFKRIYQLHGGIINYKHEVEKKGLENKFIGKNFVFDDRLGERVSGHIIAVCDQCGRSCDDYTNCANVICNALFIQCGKCKDLFEGCCTKECQSVINLPEDEQKKLRSKQQPTNNTTFRKRLHPRLAFSPSLKE